MQMIVLQRVFKLAHNVRIARRSRYTKKGIFGHDSQSRKLFKLDLYILRCNMGQTFKMGQSNSCSWFLEVTDLFKTVRSFGSHSQKNTHSHFIHSFLYMISRTWIFWSLSVDISYLPTRSLYYIFICRGRYYNIFDSSLFMDVVFVYIQHFASE